MPMAQAGSSAGSDGLAGGFSGDLGLPGGSLGTQALALGDGADADQLLLNEGAGGCMLIAGSTVRDRAHTNH